MTTADTIAPPNQYLHVDVDLLEPPDHNRDLGDLDGMTRSIATFGILLPLLVTPNGADTYRIVDGERRWRAAKTAGLPTVPCLLRERDARTADEHQVTANLHRKELTPLEEADAFKRLMDAEDLSQRDLATRLGVNQSHVSRRLALLELPDKARTAVDAGSITVEAAAELAKLKDHPDAITEIFDGGRYEPGTPDDPIRLDDVVYDVQQAQTQIERYAKVAELRAGLEAKGVRLLEEVKSPHRRIDEYSGVDVNKTKHKKEPCHAVWVRSDYGRAEAVPVCTDPTRHVAKGDSSLKTKKRTTSTSPGKSAAEKKKEADQREATKARKDFMRRLLAGKPNRDGVISVVLRRYLDDANHNEKVAILDLLGLEVGTKTSYGAKVKDVNKPLTTFAGESGPNLLRACLAFALVQGEDQLTASWGDDADRATEHCRLLLAGGYQPGPGDKTHFKRAKKAKK